MIEEALYIPLLPLVGGWTGLEYLNHRFLDLYLGFPGPKTIVTKSNPQINLRDVQNGYRVYDKRMVFKYSIGIDSSQEDVYAANDDNVVVSSFPFGANLKDVSFLSTQRYGDWFYLLYDGWHEETLNTVPTVVMVGISAADHPDVLALESQNKDVLKLWNISDG